MKKRPPVTKPEDRQNLINTRTNKLIPREYLGAFKRGQRFADRELIDDVFAFKLLNKANQGCEDSKKALLWLAKFNDEYHRGWLTPLDQDWQSKDLHNTIELRRKVESARNATHRDLSNKVKLTSFDELKVLLIKEEEK